MNKALQVFDNKEFGTIRSLTINDVPWFMGKDICQAFGDKNHNRSLGRIDEEDKREEEIIDSLGRKQTAIFVNESGLYSLLFSMQPQKANADGISNAYPIEITDRIEKLHKFKHWVTSEVLPSIRKTGSYSVHMTDYQKMMMETRAENVRIRKAALLNRIADQYNGTFKQVLQAHATKELTGEYLLPLPEVGQKTYSAGEIGQVLGISGNMVGRLAIANNLKTDQYGVWCNDKAKGHNKEIPNFRYFESVIPVMQNLAKTEKSNN